MTTDQEQSAVDFVRQIVATDIASNKNGGKVITRFPPEPNGYLHIGHAKSICINFGIAEENGGVCHLRFDDTNPCKEEDEFVQAIKNDIRWLGFDWGENEFFASDYFQQLYVWAVKLISDGNAYVDDLSAEEIRKYRGSLTTPGRESPHRNRSVSENLDLFERMKVGEFDDGQKVLRAKIDMTSPNINLRDPVIYRILKAHHHRSGNDWCIYPMYDFAHGQSDSIESITHSICTLEFEDHRPLYDWLINALGIHHPQQIEFSRLNFNYTVMSKRKLAELVNEKHVAGWDDPRMPTLCGMRRRGYTPRSIRNLCSRVGVTKFNSLTDISLLEHTLREDLNETAPRAMGVLDPLRVVIENYPQEQTEELDALNNPQDESMGSRKVPFSRVLYIERDDFMEEAPRKFFRLSVGREVRLRYAYFITCQSAIKDDNTGEVVELRCTYDPQTRGGDSPDGRKVKGTLHWVSAEHAIDAQVRLYDRLFTDPQPTSEKNDGDYYKSLNQNSLVVLTDCKLEPSLGKAEHGAKFQFERLGYFCVDPDSTAGAVVFNRTVPLRDSWAKTAKSNKGNG